MFNSLSSRLSLSLEKHLILSGTTHPLFHLPEIKRIPFLQTEECRLTLVRKINPLKQWKNHFFYSSYPSKYHPLKVKYEPEA
jgi:hypothetical protein